MSILPLRPEAVDTFDHERASNSKDGAFQSPLAYERYCHAVLSSLWTHAHGPGNNETAPVEFSIKYPATGAWYSLSPTQIFDNDAVLGSTTGNLLDLTAPLDAELREIAHDGRAAGAKSGDYTFIFPVSEPRSPATEYGYRRALWSSIAQTADFRFDRTLASRGAEMFPVLPDHAGNLDLGDRDERVHGTLSINPLHSIASTEPRILQLARHWAALRSVSPRYASVTAFSLRNLSNWLVPSAGSPSEITQHLARVCNVACTFCYLFGNPPNIAVGRGRRAADSNEIETRLRYFNPQAGYALFRSQWEINEELVDPKAPSVLAMLRRKSLEPIALMTNGNTLTPRMLDTLKSLQPLHLIVSINSLSKEQRAGLMHEREARTDVAFSSLKEMVKRRIPFGLSVVAHPAIPVTALIADLLALDHSGAAFVRVNLPSFTRFHPGRPHDQTPDHWTQVVKAICELRYEMATPIITIPSAFENELISEDADAPRVLGTIAQSPARRAGVRVGDLIVRINSFSIATRSELIAMLSLTQPPIHLTVVRLDGRTHEVTLAPEPSDGYPYVGHVINKYVFPWGMVVSPSLSNADASVIRALANELDEPLWIVTSPLMLETARRFVSRHIREARRPIDFVAVENTFLGGEIQVLDMATVVDIVDSVSRAIAVKGRRPGALFVPSTGFNELGRDLVGIHRDEIGSRLGVQVAFSSHTARFAF